MKAISSIIITGGVVSLYTGALIADLNGSNNGLALLCIGVLFMVLGGLNEVPD